MPTSYVPDTYEFDSAQSDGNQVTFYRSNSTVQEPRFLLIDRKRPVYDDRNQTWSVPEYRIRVYKGQTDSEGIPRKSKLICELSFRFPVYAVEADVDEALTDVAALVGGTGFNDSVKALDLPNCCDQADA